MAQHSVQMNPKIVQYQLIHHFLGDIILIANTFHLVSNHDLPKSYFYRLPLIFFLNLFVKKESDLCCHSLNTRGQKCLP